ncbi:MAG: T9SS type A sorting domain-containing protein [Saprospiraceae bacterium]
MKKHTIISVLIIIISNILFSQPSGSIDPTFMTKEMGFGNSEGPSNSVFTTKIQTDGKIIIGGSFSTYNRVSRKGIARINSDGTLDNSFNPGSGVNGVVNDIIILNDGKILIAGDFTLFNGTEIKSVARLNTDGTLDNTFNTVLSYTFYDSNVFGISIQSDGKIIICGDLCIPEFGGCTNYKIARLNQNGLHDNEFRTTYFDNVLKAAIQNDGKIIIVGNLSVNAGPPYILRLNTDGSRDNTFVPNLGANDVIHGVTLQNDGKIIIYGDFTFYNDIPIKSIARLNSNGSIDLSFDPGTGTSEIENIKIQNDGKLVIVGDFNSYNGVNRNRIARINMDGTIDLTFNPDIGANYKVRDLYLQKDKKIIIAGDFSSYNGINRNRIARLNIEGSLDSTFNPSSDLNNSVLTAFLKSDGKIIIGGDFVSYDNMTRNRLALINPDGSLDTTFNSILGANNRIRTISVQRDNKIIIGGDFTSFNGVSRNRITRINFDGSLDFTFITGAGTNDVVRGTVIQNDNKIIVFGNFTSFNGFTRNRITRINSDGSLDGTFNIGVGANDFIMAAAIQSDGKIIIGGGFTSFNGSSRNRIARLNSDGSLDTTFDPGSGANGWIHTISIQDDGKIIIGGAFTSYSGITKNYIARLNDDGSLDTNFSSGDGTNNIVRETAIQNDGKIIIGGNFTTFNGLPRNFIARLNTDGSIDTVFNNGIGANNSVLTIELQNDGRVFIGGAFTLYDGINRSRIGRLMGREGCIYSLSTHKSTENQSVCTNTPISMIVYNTVGITGASVSGLPDGINGIFDLNEFTLTGTPTQIGTFQYTITFTGECTTSVTNMLIVADTLTAIISGTDEICEGSYSIFRTSGGENYLWNNGESSDTITINQSGEYSVTVVSNFGCVSIGSRILTVNSNPLVNILGEAEICFGPSILWIANGGISYNWNTGDTTSSIIINTQGKYSVTVTDVKGCTASTEKMLTITSNPPEVISGDTIICQGTSSTFSTSGSGNYIWSTGANTPSIKVSVPGLYFVTVTSTDGCISTGNELLTFFSKPTAEIIGIDEVCEGSSVSWMASGGVAFIWSTGAISESINLNTAGFYRLTITDINGCTASTSKVLSTISLPYVNINVMNENCEGSSSLQWVKQFGGYSEGGTGNSVITDNFGNVFSTGQYYGESWDFDPGSDVFLLETGSGSAAYVSKLDKNGEFLWAKSIGSGWGVGTALDLDDSGNLYVTGRFGTFTVFISKINQNGEIIWTKYLESTNSAFIGSSLSLDSENNIYISGFSYFEDIIDLDPSPSEYLIYTKSFTAKYDQDGNIIWGIDFGYGSNTRVSANINDDIFVVGSKSGGIGISKINKSGTVIWEKIIDGDRIGENYGIFVDNSANLYITGYFKGTWDFDPGIQIKNLTAVGKSNSFLLKLDDNGNFKWVTQLRTSDYSFGISVAVDNEGNVYNTGTFEETTDFDPGPGENLLTSIGFTDGYILKLDSTGKFLDAMQMGAIDEEIDANSIHVDDNGFIYSTGVFSGTVDFNPSNEFYNLTNIGSSRDAFVVKLCKNFNSKISSNDSTIFCEGGIVTLTANNAIEYIWNNGETSQNIITASQGTYTVTITDYNGCTNSASKNLLVAQKPTVIIEGDSTICYPDSVTWTASGGISYLWNNGSSMESINISSPDTFTVTVTNQEGCRTAVTKILNSASDIKPSISGETEICEGSSTTFTASGGSNFLWNTGETSQSIHISTQGSYIVSVTDENGCTGVSDPLFLNVLPVPEVDIDTIGKTTFCLGDSLILISSDALSYNWSNGSSQKEIIVYSSGSYNVSITDENNCNNISKTVIVTVNPLPSVDLNPEGNHKLCKGDTLRVSAPLGYIYLWNNESVENYIDITNEGLFWVEISDQNECSNISNIITIELAPVPYIQLLIEGEMEICEGESVQLTASNADNYLWNTGQTTNHIQVTESGYYYVKGTNILGCFGFSDTVYISVLPKLEPIVNISTPALSVCSGQFVTFNSQVMNGGSEPKYQWFINGVDQNVNNQDFSTDKLDNGDNVFCRLTSSEKCLTKLVDNSNSITVAVNESVLPVVKIINIPESIFICKEYQLNLEMQNEGFSPKFKWFINTTQVGGSKELIYSDFMAGDQIYCQMESSLPCVTENIVTSDVIGLNVLPLPLPLVSINNDTIYSTNYGSQEYNYSWYHNDSLISNHLTITCNQFGPGIYNLVIEINECKISSTNLIVTNCTTASKDTDRFNKISLYPNPTFNSCILNLNKTEISKIKIIVFAANGTKVSESLYHMNFDNNKYHIDLSNLPSNLYFIKVEGSHFVEVLKILKI